MTFTNRHNAIIDIQGAHWRRCDETGMKVAFGMFCGVPWFTTSTTGRDGWQQASSTNIRAWEDHIREEMA